MKKPSVKNSKATLEPEQNRPEDWPSLWRCQTCKLHLPIDRYSIRGPTSATDGPLRYRRGSPHNRCKSCFSSLRAALYRKKIEKGKLPASTDDKQINDTALIRVSELAKITGMWTNTLCNILRGANALIVKRSAEGENNMYFTTKAHLVNAFPETWANLHSAIDESHRRFLLDRLLGDVVLVIKEHGSPTLLSHPLIKELLETMQARQQRRTRNVPWGKEARQRAAEAAAAAGEVTT